MWNFITLVYTKSLGFCTTRWALSYPFCLCCKLLEYIKCSFCRSINIVVFPICASKRVSILTLVDLSMAHWKVIPWEPLRNDTHDFSKYNSISHISTPFKYNIPRGLMARIPGFHPEGPGSIPGMGGLVFVIFQIFPNFQGYPRGFSQLSNTF